MNKPVWHNMDIWLRAGMEDVRNLTNIQQYKRRIPLEIDHLPMSLPSGAGSTLVGVRHTMPFAEWNPPFGLPST